ncbi:MAG: hypothetical protein RLZZ32_2322 [Cyanobacteriota bacterium]
MLGIDAGVVLTFDLLAKFDSRASTSAEQSWLSLARSQDPLYVAMAMRWFGRQLNDSVWRFHAAMKVDVIGQQHHQASLSKPCQATELQGTERRFCAAQVIP